MDDVEAQHSDGKPIVRLWDLLDLGLIIAWPSGVVYANQTGGYACLQSQLEGVFVPLSDDLTDQVQQLEDFFTGPKWHGGCSNGIDRETADFIDELFTTTSHLQMLRVDRMQLARSHEAWIYVDLLAITEHVYSHTILGFGPRKGVLTWPNSD